MPREPALDSPVRPQAASEPRPAARLTVASFGPGAPAREAASAPRMHAPSKLTPDPPSHCATPQEASQSAGACTLPSPTSARSPSVDSAEAPCYATHASVRSVAWCFGAVNGWGACRRGGGQRAGSGALARLLRRGAMGGWVRRQLRGGVHPRGAGGFACGRTRPEGRDRESRRRSRLGSRLRTYWRVEGGLARHVSPSVSHACVFHNVIHRCCGSLLWCGGGSAPLLVGVARLGGSLV